MTDRGYESPMDYQYERGHGPVDMTSPFARHAMENQRKRPFGTYDSPQRPSSFPVLSPPNSQTFLFSQSNQPTLPSVPRTPSFTKYQKHIDVDFSSGPENSSPAELADNEDTPEAKHSAFQFKGSDTTPSKSSPSSTLYNTFLHPTPGRGEIKKPYSNGIAKRIHKRRKAQKFDRQLVLRKHSTDDSSDDSGPSPTDAKFPSQPPPQEIGLMTSVFTFIHAYPDAPSIIAKYLQVFFNAAILAGCLYMLYSFYATIQGDVNRASEEAVAEVLAEMSQCSKNYVENRCGADNRAPALEMICSNWELCMNRDSGAVQRARLSAHTFAQIFNSFVEPISLKTMLFTATIVAVGLFVNNATFGHFRRSQEQHYNPAPRQASGLFRHPSQQMLNYPPAPGMPIHGQQGHQLGWDGNYGYSHQQQQSIEYSRSPSKTHPARSRSPEKKVYVR